MDIKSVIITLLTLITATATAQQLTTINNTDYVLLTIDEAIKVDQDYTLLKNTLLINNATNELVELQDDLIVNLNEEINQQSLLITKQNEQVADYKSINNLLVLDNTKLKKKNKFLKYALICLSVITTSSFLLNK